MSVAQRPRPRRNVVRPGARLLCPSCGSPASRCKSSLWLRAQPCCESCTADHGPTTLNPHNAQPEEGDPQMSDTENTEEPAEDVTGPTPDEAFRLSRRATRQRERNDELTSQMAGRPDVPTPADYAAYEADAAVFDAQLSLEDQAAYAVQAVADFNLPADIAGRLAAPTLREIAQRAEAFARFRDARAGNAAPPTVDLRAAASGRRSAPAEDGGDDFIRNSRRDRHAPRDNRFSV